MECYRTEKTSEFTIISNSLIRDKQLSFGANKTHYVLADGNYGLAVSESTFGGVPSTYYDLFRVENGKIAEHWDVMETLAAEDTWANSNGKF